MAKADPSFPLMAGDLLVNNMDGPGAQEIADRLKKFLPPELQQEEKGPDGKKPEIPPQVQAQMQQMGQMVEQLTQALNEAQGQVAQAEQQINQAEQAMKSKEAELMLKAGEIQMKGDLEQQKLALDAQKLDLEGQKLALEAEKMRLEELRIMADAVKAHAQPQQETEDPEGPELEAPPAPTMTREDLALMFQGLLAGMSAAQQPTPPMPPQVVALHRGPDGGLVGTITEVNP